MYSFWQDSITQLLARDGAQAAAVVNLASQEYAKAIDFDALPVPSVTPVFWERKGDQLKQIGVSAKAARGAMTRWIYEENVTQLDDLVHFTERGYQHTPEVGDWAFVR